MYLYLYDALLKKRQYERVLTALETKIHDFGIGGRIIRLTSLLSPRQLVQEELRRERELTTVVVVGDDAAFSRIITQAGDLPVVFGWVPVGQKLEVAEILRLPYGAEAAVILSKRRILELDLGQCNQYFFMDYCHLEPTFLQVKLDDNFKIGSAEQKIECTIWNLPSGHRFNLPRGYRPNPMDRQLEVVLQPWKRHGLFGKEPCPVSVLPFREAKIKFDRPVNVELDGQVLKETQVTLRLCAQPLKLIVEGKQIHWQE